MEVKAISVSTFNNYIAKIIDSEELLSQIGVYGEIVDLKISKNIAFFGLKDDTALLNCVCFFEHIYKTLENGKEFTLIGSPQYYVKGGRLTFKVNRAIETGNKGLNYLKFLELKEKLNKLGYFDTSRKKPLKFYNNNIGVVTSAKGAAIRDIISVSTRRDPSVNISVYNAAVQGATAPAEIAAGIDFMDKLGFDLIIVARGGGSDEDLSAFNSELIANAIYKANTPIVSAVGHEVDTTICDFCADLRAPTPSAAAELVTKNIDSELTRFESIVNSVYNAAMQNINNYQNVLNYDARDINGNFCAYVNLLNNKLILNKKSFALLAQNLITTPQTAVEKAELAFTKLNPLNILKLGYAKVSKGGACVSAEVLNVGDDVLLEFADGKVSAKITDK